MLKRVALYLSTGGCWRRKHGSHKNSKRNFAWAEEANAEIEDWIAGVGFDETQHWRGQNLGELFAIISRLIHYSFYSENIIFVVHVKAGA